MIERAIQIKTPRSSKPTLSASAKIAVPSKKGQIRIGIALINYVPGVAQALATLENRKIYSPEYLNLFIACFFILVFF